jgi:CheY-like chemotaxis protein
MPAGGRLQISTRAVGGDFVQGRFQGAKAKQYVAIEVFDSGAGMDEETRSRIFEPFFTTKESGKGTGLGLAVVFGIVQTHKGYIEVESGVGAGTTFHIYFPVEAFGSPSPDNLSKLVDTSVVGHETILLVEDEPMLSEITKMALTSNGYVVLSAKDGLQAFDVYIRHFRDIQLVFTDMDLPKLAGESLVSKLIEVNPSVKIIATSGYLESEAKERILGKGVKAFVPKPYEHAKMLAMVREILDAKS